MPSVLQGSKEALEPLLVKVLREEGQKICSSKSARPGDDGDIWSGLDRFTRARGKWKGTINDHGQRRNGNSAWAPLYSTRVNVC